VGISASSGRRLRAAAAALLPLCATPLLAACAANAYAGVPLAAGAADPGIQDLARRARAGDGRARLELGIRYEEGRGVPLDLDRAERLYLAAAFDRGSRLDVYLPPVSGGAGRMLSVDGPGGGGLDEALVRLARLAALRDGRCAPPPAAPNHSNREFETGTRPCL
jgi:hypothetical protein